VISHRAEANSHNDCDEDDRKASRIDECSTKLSGKVSGRTDRIDERFEPSSERVLRKARSGSPQSSKDGMIQQREHEAVDHRVEWFARSRDGRVRLMQRTRP